MTPYPDDINAYRDGNPEFDAPTTVTCADCGNTVDAADATEVLGAWLCGVRGDDKRRGCVHSWVCVECDAVVFGSDLDRETMTCADCEWLKREARNATATSTR